MWSKRLIAALSSFHIAIVSCTTFAGQTIMKSDEDSFIRPQGVLPNLADLLTIQTQSSIYYSYARDTDISKRFTEDNSNGITLFVPTNKAVQALARKPNDDPHADISQLSNEEFYVRSSDRVKQWVGAHIVPMSPIDLTSATPYDTLTPGVSVTFKPAQGQSRAPVGGGVETQDGLPDLDDDKPVWKKYILNNGIKILDEKVASNGVIYIIDGTVDID